MKYQVLASGKPAEIHEPFFTNSIYDTFEEAKQYAKNFFGEWFPPDETKIKLNIPFEYNGYGDTIEIRGLYNH